MKVSNFFGKAFTVSLAAFAFCCGVKAEGTTPLDESNVVSQSVSVDESEACLTKTFGKVTSICLRGEECGLDSGNITWEFEDCGDSIFEEHREFLKKVKAYVEKSTHDLKSNNGSYKKTVVIITCDNLDENIADVNNASSLDGKKDSEKVSDNIDNGEVTESISEDISEQVAE